MSVATLEARQAQAGLTAHPVGASIGAEIEGVDLARPIDAGTRDALKALLLQYKVLFFRDQDITRDQQVAFALNFGELYAHPTGGTETHRVIQPIAAEAFKKSGRQQNHWHTDTSWRID